MLKVLPIQSKDHQKECAERCAVPYIPDALAYEATVDGALVGICQFRVTAEGGLIYDLATVPGINPCAIQRGGRKQVEKRQG